MLMVAGYAYADGAYERAADIYRGAVIARPQWAIAWVGLGASAYRCGAFDAAEEAYRKALTAEPKHQQATLYLGELLVNEDRNRAEGFELLERAAKLDHESVAGVRAAYVLRENRQNPDWLSPSQNREER
jgi:tetratricopeptide (TPR) repeat protein